MTASVGDMAQRHGSRDAAVVSLCLWLAGLLDGLDGDLVSEGFELSDGAGFGLRGVLAGVVVGAVELGVGEQTR